MRKFTRKLKFHNNLTLDLKLNIDAHTCNFQPKISTKTFFLSKFKQFTSKCWLANSSIIAVNWFLFFLCRIFSYVKSGKMKYLLVFFLVFEFYSKGEPLDLQDISKSVTDITKGVFVCQNKLRKWRSCTNFIEYLFMHPFFFRYPKVLSRRYLMPYQSPRIFFSLAKIF